MNHPRVFLVWVNRLVCEAVDMLLKREGIEPLGMENDPDRALDRVHELNPDVVLVEGDGAVKDARLMSKLAQLVYERDNLRVIRLCLEDGQLHIYHQEQRRLLSTKDLMAAIRALEEPRDPQIA